MDEPAPLSEAKTQKLPGRQRRNSSATLSVQRSAPEEQATCAARPASLRLIYAAVVTMLKRERTGDGRSPLIASDERS
jgi:hypothetical protein